MKLKAFLNELDILFGQSWPMFGKVIWVKNGKIKMLEVFSINYLLSIENERLVKLTKGCNDPTQIRRMLLELSETW